MNLIRWAPARSSSDLLTFRSELDRMFDGLLTPGPAREPAVFSPAVDIEETPDAFVFRADLPGVNAKDVKVKLHGDTLTLRAERLRSSEKREERSHRVERAFGSFERSFTLHAPVRGDQVKAVYRDGVLEVHVPKADEARAREIEVQVG